MHDPLDECLRVVADSRRRTILDQVRDTDETTRADLVDALLRTEPDSERESLAVQLHHNHLPKLAEYGAVEYDADDGTVEYRPDELVESVLDALPTERAHPAPEPRPE